ncbi:hypothetical protein [Xylella fastidiosa]|uniref:hypothetical protein n=1 Tax=Xylella fastidiosa TaxID=2371 RepID=UPI0024170CC5|nr:hypothetical protein [Xylella fastidiosa]MDG4872840.1 hypothetical protein [Xylella fastidiosa subsp. multiplex]
MHAAQGPLVKLDSGQALDQGTAGVAKIADLLKHTGGLEAARAADEDSQQRDQAMRSTRQMGRMAQRWAVTERQAMQRRSAVKWSAVPPHVSGQRLTPYRTGSGAMSVQTAVDLAFNVLASAPVTASAGLAAEAVNEALRRQIVKTSDADLDPRAAYIQQLTHATYGTSAP